jgi:hypothetical protein
MSGPVPPPAEGGGRPYPQAGWTAPDPSGTWTAQPPAWVASAPPAAAPPRHRAVLLVLAGAAIGAAVTGLLAFVVLLAGAREMVVAAGTSAGEGIAAAMSEDVGGVYGYEEEGALVPSGMADPEQVPAVAPGVLGPDPVLDAYAQGCFTGDLQSCDDLLYESPPLSRYEQYAGTCGGRVAQGAVYACTELD